MQRLLPRLGPPHFWRWLRRFAVVISALAGVAKLVSVVHEWHHSPQSSPSLAPAPSVPVAPPAEKEALGPCVTPPLQEG